MMVGTDDRKAKRGPLRSSIACLRCRKSKIKCDNRGPTGPCDTCIKTGKDCRYPDQTSVAPKRHEPPGTARPDQQGGSERKRPRRHDDASRPDPHYPAAVAEDVLSAHYLTPSLWHKLFSIYTRHFLTELPFLHLPTLKEKIGRKCEGSQADWSHETNLVLLGVLTLTARFEPSLVQYVANTRSPLPGSAKTRPVQLSPDSSAASEYFAEALITALGPLSMCMTVASVERVQAFLMLGLYEWIQSKPKTGGLGAWMYVGLAIRMAQALRLGFGDKRDPAQIHRPRTLSLPPKTSVSPTQMIVTKEVRRRTMFSCLILDRMLSCGKDRVSTIRSEDLQIRLPCAEFDFDYSTEVTHRFLKDEDDEGRSRPNRTDSVLGCFIRLVDIWGEISKFTFAGGRLSEKCDIPPWHEDAKFRQLREELEGFYTDLPEVYQWSVTNFHRHGGNSSGSIFVSLHMLGSVCQIMLHREYIPFIPIRCKGPIGPLDEPTFTSPRFNVPDGFWEESAEQIFRAAKNIVEVIRLCEGNVPMSSLALFAIWTAAFVGIYAFHFPHMDTKGYMLGPGDKDGREPGAQIDVAPEGSEATPISTTYQTLARMSQQLKLAGSYVRYFHEMDHYYHRVRQEFSKYDRQSRSVVGNGGDGKLSIIHGGEGGGLEEWKVQGSKIINNGAILEHDEKHDGSDNPSPDSTAERGSSYGPEGHSSASADRLERGRTPRSAMSASTFTAINSSSVPSSSTQHEGAAPSPLGQLEPRVDGLLAGDGGWRNYPSGSHHHQQQQQQLLLQSPTQSPYVTSPQMSQRMIGSLASIPPYANGGPDFINYLNSTEHASWNFVPGGPDTLAHGSDSPDMYLDAQGAFWPAIPEVGIIQQIGSYD